MKKAFLSTLVLTALALSSCTFINIISTSKPDRSTSQPSTSKKESAIISSTYENYVKNSVYYESAIPTNVQEGETTSKSKYLVLPVWFDDSADLIKPGESKESILAKVSTAFGGSEEETGWNSVKTFYEKESSGKKTFDIVVANWYECNCASDAVVGKQNDRNIASNTEEIIYEAIENYFEMSNDDRKQYDTDGDGYLDAVAVVYAIQDYKSDDFDWGRRYRKTGESINNLWAYVYWFQNPDYQNLSKPGPNAYLWASYDFANVSKSAPRDYPVKVDAHCYIHETGHLFGLDDYYDYTGDGKPAGGFSMQDYNVGGHDPFSVISLGWGEVYAPKESETITIDAFSTSHQVILLSPNFEDSIFDEYLLLELYTPTGLNELDSRYKYASSYPKGPTASGIRVWHVDARLAYKEARGEQIPYSPSQITNKIDTQYYYNMLCRNNTFDRGTYEQSPDYFSPLAGTLNFAQYHLLELIRNNDIFKHHDKEDVGNEDLFTEGNSFDMNTYSNWFYERGVLNSGKQLGWSFTVDAISDTQATITVTKA